MRPWHMARPQNLLLEAKMSMKLITKNRRPQEKSKPCDSLSIGQGNF